MELVCAWGALKFVNNNNVEEFCCNILDSQPVDSPQELVVQADPLLCHAESVLPAMSKIFWALGMRAKLSNSQFSGCATFSSATSLDSVSARIV